MKRARWHWLYVGTCWGLVSVGPAVALPRLTPTPAGVEWRGAELSGVPARSAPVARWYEALADTGAVGCAVRIALADTLASHGRIAAAESLLRAPSLARSLWALDARLRLAGYRAAAGDTAEAAIVLAQGIDLERSSPLEQRHWSARMATYRAALGDTAVAESLAFRATEAGPLDPEVAREADRTIQRLCLEPPGTAPRNTEAGRALSDWFAGRRGLAAERLAAIARRDLRRGEKGSYDISWAIQMATDGGRPRLALALIDSLGKDRYDVAVTKPGFDAESRGSFALRRARALHAAGETQAERRLLREIVRGRARSQAEMLAAWELALTARGEGRWRDALHGFLLADSIAWGIRDGATPRVQSARGEAGLMAWMLGDTRHAEQIWHSWGDARSLFWLGVGWRDRGDPRGDSLLRAEFAQSPLRVPHHLAARETLGVSVWRGRALALVTASPSTPWVEEVNRLALPLALPADAARIVTAHDRQDPRVDTSVERWVGTPAWRAIAAAAYASGDLPNATRAAERVAFGAGEDSLEWDLVPWLYPPAYEPEVRAAAREAGIEPALLWAVAREVSRFDARLITGDERFGIMQLTCADARRVSAALHEPAPAGAELLQPKLALRYGAHRLRMMLDRFRGHRAPALLAYLEGEGAVRSDWRALIARGGEMLFLDLATSPEHRSPVHAILGGERVYRELRPFAASGP